MTLLDTIAKHLTLSATNIPYLLTGYSSASDRPTPAMKKSRIPEPLTGYGIGREVAVWTINAARNGFLAPLHGFSHFYQTNSQSRVLA